MRVSNFRRKESWEVDKWRWTPGYIVKTLNGVSCCVVLCCTERRESTKMRETTRTNRTAAPKATIHSVGQVRGTSPDRFFLLCQQNSVGTAIHSEKKKMAADHPLLSGNIEGPIPPLPSLCPFGLPTHQNPPHYFAFVQRTTSCCCALAPTLEKMRPNISPPTRKNNPSS